MSWDLEFAEPIALPNNGVATTLRHVIAYIGGLSVDEQDSQEWRKARKCIFQAADEAGSLWFARVAVVQALQRAPADVV